jgi:hypothetical protein
MKEVRSALPRRRRAHTARQALWLAAVLALPGGAQNIPQQPRTPMPQPIGQKVGDNNLDEYGGDFSQQEERMRALNRERQKSLVSDTNKLLKLATELDMEIKSAGGESLNSSEMRKLATIEKLAHNVKDKMTYSISAPSAIPQLQQQPVWPR